MLQRSPRQPRGEREANISARRNKGERGPGTLTARENTDSEPVSLGRARRKGGSARTLSIRKRVKKKPSRSLEKRGRHSSYLRFRVRTQRGKRPRPPQPRVKTTFLKRVGPRHLRQELEKREDKRSRRSSGTGKKVLFSLARKIGIVLRRGERLTVRSPRRKGRGRFSEGARALRGEKERGGLSTWLKVKKTRRSTWSKIVSGQGRTDAGKRKFPTRLSSDRAGKTASGRASGTEVQRATQRCRRSWCKEGGGTIAARHHRKRRKNHLAAISIKKGRIEWQSKKHEE